MSADPDRPAYRVDIYVRKSTLAKIVLREKLYSSSMEHDNYINLILLLIIYMLIFIANYALAMKIKMPCFLTLLENHTFKQTLRLSHKILTSHYYSLTPSL